MPEEIDWQNQQSIWAAHPSNHRLMPGGSEYERYLWVRDQIEARSRVLDVGCNCGQLAVNLAQDKGCQVVGVDVVWDFIEHCRTQKGQFGEFYCFDFSRIILTGLHALGLGPEAFDVVTALEVIEHPIDIRGFVGRVNYVLRPGGRLVITTPHPESPTGGYRYYREHPHHVRMWTPWRLEQVFGPMVSREDIYYNGSLGQIGAVFEVAK